MRDASDRVYLGNRELYWALLCFAELFLLGFLPFIVPSQMLGTFWARPGDAILGSFFLAVLLTPFLLLSIWVVRFLVFSRGWRLSSFVLLLVSHVLAASFAGAALVVVSTRIDRFLVTVVIFLILILPRLAFPRLRTEE